MIVNPTGEFPLGDDWSYGLTVKRLVESGDYIPTAWMSMPLITQVLWGSLFCIPGGFSFEAIRLSTIVLSMLAVFCLYYLIRDLGQPRWFAILGSLTMAYSPIYFALSFNFMTDVPFTSLILIASVFYSRYLKGRSNFDLFFAIILTVAATLIRQIGIAVPMAFGIISIMKNGFNKKYLIPSISPLVIAIISLLTFEQWLKATGRMPSIYGAHTIEVFRALTFIKTIPTFLENAFLAVMYLGWFLLPVLILLLYWIRGVEKGRISKHFIASIAVLGIGTLVMVLQDRFLMPSMSNIVVKSGIGALTLTDKIENFGNIIVELPAVYWIVISVFGLSGAALFLTALSFTINKITKKYRLRNLESSEITSAFFLLSSIIYLFPILISGYIFFDRYLIPSIPFFLLGIISIMPNLRRIKVKSYQYSVAFVILMSTVLFSVGGLRDYFAWNRVRWEALTDLLGNGTVKPEEVDGGFEFNGLYLFDPDYKQSPEKSWWWVHDNKYIISFGQIPGYEIMSVYTYDRILPPHQGKILVLKRDDT